MLVRKCCIYLIPKPFIGVDVPLNSYTVAQTEWANTKGVFTLYVSQNISSDKFIPILITLQEEVDQNAMLETIEHSSSVYKNFKALPVVLIISNKSSSSLKNNGEFSVIENSFLMQCESKFWANKCFLFFRGGLVNVSMVNTSNPALFTVCQFLSDSNKLLTLSHDSDTHTICLTCEATTILFFRKRKYYFFCFFRLLIL